MVRRWLSGRWTPHLIGALAGLLIATSVSAFWHRTHAQPAVTLLGSGRGLSALVTTERTRLLIISGDDPIAFANAFAAANPATMRRVDLVVVAPGEGPARVAMRAISLVSPERIMAIEDGEGLAFDGVESVRLIGAPRTITLESTLLVDIDPGAAMGSPDSGWSIRISSPSGDVLLANAVPRRVDPDIRLIAVMGTRLTTTAHFPGVALTYAIDVERDESSSIPQSSAIAAGSYQRIPFKQSGISIPAEWVIAN